MRRTRNKLLSLVCITSLFIPWMHLNAWQSTSSPAMPSRTLYPTATLYPASTYSAQMATAAADGECFQSFETYAYRGPQDRSFGLQNLLPAWEVEATEIAGESFDIGTVLNARSINGHSEIWLGAKKQVNAVTSELRLAIYQPDTKAWELVPIDIENTGLSVRQLFVTRDGVVWGSVVWSSNQQYPNLQAIPIFSKFNEDTRRFELAEGVLTLPAALERNYFRSVDIVLDSADIFWIFVPNDGLYRYDPAAETTEKRANLPDFQVTETALAPDGSIYFEVYNDQEFLIENFLRIVQGTLFQFIPETNEVVSIDIPSRDWPFFSGLLIDHNGRLYLGSIAYREPDGSWHLMHPDPDWFLSRADGGSYSYVLAPPRLIFESSDGLLWYTRELDTGGWVDGTAWYDPQTGEGCLITNYAANVVEDAERQLWLVANGVLYRHELGL